MTVSRAKDQNVQALRGLAAMLVALLHAFYALDEHGRHASLSDLLFLHTLFGSMGVDLFFVISGAVMALSVEQRPSAGSFLRARYRRVVPLFWLAAVLTIGINLLVNDMPAPLSLLNSITILPIFDHGVYHSPVPFVGWTLAYELYFYLVVGLGLLLPQRATADVVALILLVGAVAGMVFQPIWLPIAGIACNPILIEFLFGFWALRASRTPLARRYGPYLAALGALTLTLGILRGYDFSTLPQATVAGQTSLRRVISWGAPSALLLIGLLGRSMAYRPVGLLSRLGDASYAIYLIHPALFTLMMLAWRWWSPLGCDLMLLTMTASAALVGILVNRYVERPLLRHLGGPTGKRQPSFDQLQVATLP